MATRNGDEVEARLRECSLYDPQLDLAINAPGGDPAAYGLFWFDEVTGVGMLEPLRVEETHQRNGLARALITVGLNRLVGRGAQRLKAGFNTDASRNLYVYSGFTLALDGSHLQPIVPARRAVPPCHPLPAFGDTVLFERRRP